MRIEIVISSGKQSSQPQPIESPDCGELGFSAHCFPDAYYVWFLPNLPASLTGSPRSTGRLFSHHEAVMHCEIIRTLSSQPEDHETGSIAPELSVTYRIFWSVEGGLDIEWEPLSWTMDQTEGQNFNHLYGQYLKSWCRSDFELSRDYLEHDAEEFAPYREFWHQQAIADRAHHQHSVL